MRPGYVLIQLNCATSRYFGMMSDSTGIIMVAIKAPKATRRNGKRRNTNAYADRIDVTRTPSATVDETMRLFAYWRASGKAVVTREKLPSSSVGGNNGAGNAVSWSSDMSEPATE